MKASTNHIKKATLEQVKNNSAFGIYRPPNIINGEVSLIVPGFWTKLPLINEVLLLLPVVIVSILCLLIFYWINTEEVAAAISIALMFSCLFFYYKLRSAKTKKRYNLSIDGILKISPDSLYIPSIYTQTKQGIQLPAEQIKQIDFTWNYSRFKPSATSSSSIDLMDIHITTANNQCYVLPVWISKTHDLLYTLLLFNYPVYLKRVEQRLFKNTYNALFIIAILSLVLGTAYSLYYMLFGNF